MTKAVGFDQNAYWIQRHQRLKGDPRSVGNLAKTRDQNLAAEMRIQRWVTCAARILEPYASVLDVGCGYGRVASCFCDVGYEYFGVDVSDVAIEAAKRLEPRGTYVVGSALDYEFSRSFDLVCALYVFVHFVDDDDWARLILQLAATLTTGGGLLFADDFPQTTIRPVAHVAQRPLSAYERIFERCGLVLDPSFRERLSVALGTTNIPPAYLAIKGD